MTLTRFIRRPEVEHLTDLSRPTIYRYIQQGQFPEPVKITKRAVGWRESDIIEWMNTR
jgi:prophage regulatory protein